MCVNQNEPQMKKTFYFFAFLIFPCLTVFSQQISGIAAYEIRMLHSPGSFTMSDADKQKLPLQVQLQLQASMNAAVHNMQLEFDGDKALFHQGLQSDTEEQYGNSQMKVSAKMEGNGKEIYRDLAAKSETNVSVLGDNTFRVTAPLETLAWKLSDEVKMIAGHTCYKATLPGDPVRRIVNGKEEKLPATDITAWYAKDIPVQHGPGRYYGLPGLILQVDEGFRSITCIGIDVKTGTAVAPPTSGKAIGKAEFDKLNEAYIREIVGKTGTSQMRIQQN